MPDPSEWSEKPGATAFVGGISSDTSGAVVMEARRFGVASDKLWVNGKNGILMLTGNISSDAEEPIFTTINQCLLRGRVVRRNIGGKTAVWHDGLAYFFILGEDEVVIEQVERSGDWRDLRSASTDAEALADVFLLGVDHGVKPTNGQTACWVSTMTESDFKIATHPALKVLQNTHDLQAVEQDGTVILAFHSAGTIEVEGLGIITADTACLMTCWKEGGALQCTVVDPTQTQESVCVTLNGEDQVIMLPGNENAGATLPRG